MRSIMANYCVRGRERSNVCSIKKGKINLKIFLSIRDMVAFWSYLSNGENKKETGGIPEILG